MGVIKPEIKGSLNRGETETLTREFSIRFPDGTKVNNEGIAAITAFLSGVERIGKFMDSSVGDSFYIPFRSASAVWKSAKYGAKWCSLFAVPFELIENVIAIKNGSRTPLEALVDGVTDIGIAIVSAGVGVALGSEILLTLANVANLNPVGIPLFCMILAPLEIFLVGNRVSFEISYGLGRLKELAHIP